MRTQSRLPIAFFLGLLFLGYDNTAAGGFSVQFAFGVEEICLGEEPLEARTRFPAEWVGWEICVFQTPDESGAWTDLPIVNEQGQFVGPAFIFHREPRESAGILPIYQRRPDDSLGDPVGFIRRGLHGPLRMYCVFISANDHPDFLLPPHYPGHEELRELRRELFEEYSADEIRALGVNRVSFPILLKRCNTDGN